MNVLQIHNRYQIPGGEDTVVENERRMLEARGHRVVQYIRDNSELSDAGGVKKLLLYAESFWSLRTYREVRQLIRREHIDIVHIHNTVHLISSSVFYAALRERVPIVQTLHNFRMICPGATLYRDSHICEDCLSRGKSCAIRHSCYRNSRLQTAAVTLSLYVQQLSGVWGKVHYICLTELNREKLLTLNRRGNKVIPPEHVYIKGNFTKSTEFENIVQRDTDYVGELGENAATVSGMYYIALGRLEHIKGTHLIVKAFAHSGHPLVLVGQGAQEEQIRSYILRHKIKNIRLAGQLSHEAALELLRGARALVIMPQWYETFGMNVIEAYAQGVPVISNDIGNATALVEDGVTGVKCGNTVADLEQAIRRFEGMEWEELSRAAKQEYIEKYGEEKNYRILMDIYKKARER